MNDKGSINLMLMVLAVGAALVGFVAFVQLNPLSVRPTQLSQVPTQSPPVESTPAPNFDKWEIPSIPKEYIWIEVELLADDQYDSRDIYIDTTPETPENFADIEYISIRTPGHLYSTTVKDSTPNFDSEGYTVKFTFEEALVKRGWQNPIKLGKYRINGIAADGVLGSTYGYVKIINGDIRTIVVSYHKRGESFDHETGLRCPCFTDLEIFIGEPVKLADYL